MEMIKPVIVFVIMTAIMININLLFECAKNEQEKYKYKDIIKETKSFLIAYVLSISLILLILLCTSVIKTH